MYDLSSMHGARVVFDGAYFASELAGLATRNQPDAASDGQQVTLAREQQGDNQVRIQSDAQGAVGNFVRLLVGSLQMRMGTTSVETGRAAATGATVETRGAANQPEQLNDTIDNLGYRSHHFQRHGKHFEHVHHRLGFADGYR